MRKELLENIINKSLKLTMTTYFGENCYVKVKSLDFIRSKKSHLVCITIFVTDIEKSSEIFPDGLEIITKLGWKVIGRDKPLIVTSSIEYIN
jgi:hypothetical protein